MLAVGMQDNIDKPGDQRRKRGMNRGDHREAGLHQPPLFRKVAELQLHYAISISLSTSRLKQVGEKNLLKPLRDTAEAISRELGFAVRES